MTAALNDDFADRIVLVGESGTETTGIVDAPTTEGGEPDPGPFIDAKTVWWEWTCPDPAPFDAVAFDTTGSSLDGGLAVYTGTVLASLTLVAWQDDYEETDAQARLVIPVTPGETYVVQQSRGWPGPTYEYVITWAMHDRPANDDFADAQPLSGFGPMDGDNTWATLQDGEPAQGNEGYCNGSVWYRWTCPDPAPDSEVAFTLTLDDPGSYPHWGIYTGAAADDLTVASGAEGDTEITDDTPSTLPVAVAAGVDYFIRVGTRNGFGPFTLEWDQAPEPPETGGAEDEPEEADPNPDDLEQDVLVPMEDEADVPDDDPVIDADLSSIGVLRRISETYPAPTLDEDTGRPAGWVPDSVLDEAWGRLAFDVGGAAVTLVRGVRTRLTSLALQEPFGEGPASLIVPGASLWDKGQAGFEWLREEADVNISQVDAAGAYVRTVWSGIVLTISPSRGGWVLGLEGAFAGPAGMFPHRPKLTERERDWGQAMTFAIRRASQSQARRKALTEVLFGITTRDRGTRSETLLEYVSRGLSMSQQEDGDQWTLARALDGSGHPIRRKYEWRLKDRATVDLTVRAGQRGIDLSGLRRDLADVARIVFGEGVNHAGGRWRNTRLPNVGKETIPPYPGSPLSLGDEGPDVLVWQIEVMSDGHRTGDQDSVGSGVFGDLEEDAARDIQRSAGLPVTGVVNEATWDATWSNGDADLNLGGARFDAIAIDTRVMPWKLSSNGSVLAVNPDRDRSVLPLGRMVSYGSDVTKRQASRSARADLVRSADAGWRGQIVIDGVDPPQMSRLDILEGMNIRLLDFDDEPLMHIAGVRWSESGPSFAVTLDVDEHARDLLTLAQLRARDREARADPARMAIAQLRRSAQIRDTPAMWDAEGGFGMLPARDVPAGRWRVFLVPAGKYGSLSRVRMRTTPATRFTVALFGGKVSAAWLNAVMPYPHHSYGDTSYLPWDKPSLQAGLRSRLFIDAWGGYQQRLGYSPGYETSPTTGSATGHAVTGKADIDASTDYALADEPRLYVAVWAQDATSISGQLYLLPNE